MSTNKINYTESSGNVYQDLGFEQSEEKLAKAKLAMRIESIIEEKNLKQKEATQLLQINQPEVSALMNGKFDGFSMERLIHFLNLLNQDVEIVIKTKRGRAKTHGSLKVALC